MRFVAARFLVQLFALGTALLTGGLCEPAMGQNIAPQNRLAVASQAFPEYRSGRDLRKESQGATSDLTVRFVVQSHQVVPPPGPPIDPFNNLRVRSIVARSDLIAVCSVTNSKPFLSADGSFVLTQYELKPDTTLLSKAPERWSGSAIYLVAPGGDLPLNGHTVHASVSNVPLFQVGGTYLFYLGYDRKADFFKLTEPEILQVIDGELKALTHDIAPPNAALIGSEAEYLDALRANISAENLEIRQ